MMFFAVMRILSKWFQGVARGRSIHQIARPEAATPCLKFVILSSLRLTLSLVLPRGHKVKHIMFVQVSVGQD